jgi:hypothetical protein
MAYTEQDIENEFQKLTNWHDIYRSPLCTRTGYTEKISELLLKEFDQINWTENGLRTNKFKQLSHVGGKCNLNTDISQFLEKRFCIALYNSKHFKHFGKFIDYEIPLTEPGQENGKQTHGKIDLLSKINNDLYFIEAKNHNSTESLLKAILEIFVYTYRLHNNLDRIMKFKEEYETIGYSSVPAILTFAGARSGNQIKEIHKYPKLQNLLKTINEKLNTKGIKNIEFYVVEEFIIEKALVSTPPYNKDNSSKNYKIELNKPITIKKYLI